jgi:hypothetical protein
MRQCNDEIYKLANDQALVKKFKKKKDIGLYCKTPNVVYLHDCHVCGSQCVGESVQPFNKRMNGHRSDHTKKTLLPVSQQV